jgi:hypothetical protein
MEATLKEKLAAYQEEHAWRREYELPFEDLLAVTKKPPSGIRWFRGENIIDLQVVREILRKG